MFFRIEFGKLFRRKFNYLFALILILLNLGVVFKLDSLSLFYDKSLVDIIFNIVLKIDLVLILFIYYGIELHLFVQRRLYFKGKCFF